MANMVKKINYLNNEKQIMLADSQMVSFGVVVGNTGVTADTNGRKILKAGTPITGDLRARNTAFKKATDAEGASNAKGILLHDVDVTEGNANGVIVLFGFVDLDKLDKDVYKLITDSVEKALDAKVTFLTGSGKTRIVE